MNPEPTYTIKISVERSDIPGAIANFELADIVASDAESPDYLLAPAISIFRRHVSGEEQN